MNGRSDQSAERTSLVMQPASTAPLSVGITLNARTRVYPEDASRVPSRIQYPSA